MENYVTKDYLDERLDELAAMIAQGFADVVGRQEFRDELLQLRHHSDDRTDSAERRLDRRIVKIEEKVFPD